MGHRLRAHGCELCGATEHCQVPQVRTLADLHRPGRRENPLWERRLAARHRKPLVVCPHCQEASPREWASWRRGKK
ncbi:MAG TPA: RNA-directed DNA polymerase [Candidatus Binatia bacterium]|nr:RNA-directed DNA polymerase [Candidatus Binatia bacterium]